MMGSNEVSNGQFQRDAFTGLEGDNFYERNRHALREAASATNIPAERISKHITANGNTAVLEIGCAIGNNLIALQALRPIRPFGIDPSSKAVEAGRATFPGLQLAVATADKLPFEDESMDVVWFGFSLYLVDRSLLQRVR